MSAQMSSSPPTGERLRRLESITDTSLARLGVADLLGELLDRLSDLLDVDTAAALLLDPASNHLVATAARGPDDEVRQGVRIPVGHGFAGRVAATGRPVTIDRVDGTTAVSRTLRDQGVQSLLGVPMLAGGSVMGVLHVGSLRPRTFTADDVKLLELAADRAALAVQSRQSDEDRAAATALQRSLVPARLPTVLGLELAARYIPGEHGGIGGDWYDVFTLPSGWLCVVVGDVVGHGLRSAVVMGRLRSALRAYALDHADPAQVLSKLNRKVQHFEPDVMATVLYGMFEPSLDRVHVSVAGHPPPVLAAPGRPATLVELPVDPPVGVRSGVSRRTSTIDLPPGATVCFYTDGLVERRGSSLDEGQSTLRDVVSAGPAEDVCADVMRELVGGQPAGDDIAVLVVRRKDLAEISELDLTVPALPGSLHEIRVAMRRWLALVGAGADDVADLLVAVGEACANVVEHAYGPRGGSIVLRMVFDAPDVQATVSDTGRQRPPRGTGRGRGTMLMRQCCDEVNIDHDSEGTTVRMRRRLGAT